MKLSKVSIRRGVTFTMIYLIAVGFGLFGLTQLKLNLYPELEFPMMVVISQYSGVGPEDIETVVTRPIEEAVATSENIKEVSSESKQGLSLVYLEFAWGTDMDQAEMDVRNNLDYIRDYLPADMSDPLLFKFDISQMPIMYIMVNSDQHGPAELRQIALDEVEPRLERIPGVATANTSGGLTREIRVMIDPVRLRAHHLAIQQVTAALQQNNLQIPSGFIDDQHTEFSIQTQGEYDNVEQIRNTAVTTMNGSVIRVRDVADVIDGFKEVRQQVWTNGRPAVMVFLQKQSDANIVNTSDRINAQMADLQSAMPEGVSLDIFWDQADFINQSMSNLGSTAVQAIVLAFLVLLFFLRNFRSSLIVAVSIPISILLSFAVMMLADLTLNVISMAGLALAVGLLVDNAIVVLESIYRLHEEEGQPADKAADQGASEVGMAITASTLTTISVFVPILFVPGLSGQLFRDMGLTICFSLIVSLLVALTLIPLLASRFLRVRQVHKQKGMLGNWARRIETMMNRLYARYGKWLDWSLLHRKIVILLSMGAFVVSVIILVMLGAEFLPENDMGFIEMQVERSPGISLNEMAKTMRTMEDIVREEVPEAKLTYVDFGQGEGIMALFGSQGSNRGSMQITLPDQSERERSQFEIQDVLRDRFNELPDTEVKFIQGGFNQMFGEGDIVIQIFGFDLEVARALSEEIKTKVSEIEGVDFVQSTLEDASPELAINLDRDRIADLGLSTAQVGGTLQNSLLGNVATRYREGGDEYDVRVRLAEEYRTSKQYLDNILFVTPQGRQVPLRAISNIEYSNAPQTINREDQERQVSVNIDIAGRDLKSVTKDVRNVVDDIAVPTNFRLEIGGAAEEQQESFFYLLLAMFIAVILTYMVMASQFESFIDPFVILFTVPLSFIGVALGLLLTGTIFSAIVFIGVIMLVGIVVNNGIVLIDYINQLRDRNYELFDAIREAGRVRIRPVLMTALTTILAMFPLALGLGASGESWAPMARAVMGGLIVATGLTLIVVPTIYATLEVRSRRRKEKKAAKQARIENA
ncbi:MAG: efflux RND transporter permease subunit [candidate division KSB1 bacterium]|nr:efflux RND transporter permease subunit [candidate division KSB1 bacterium]